MTGLPSFKDLNPGEWVRVMRSARSRSAERAAALLDAHRLPAAAQPGLQEVLDEFTRMDLNTPAVNRLEAPLSVEVHAHPDSLVFWVFPTRSYLTIRVTPAGYWWLEHSGKHPKTNDPHEIHVEIMLRLLKTLPWADDDTLAEIAAIELATRAG